MTTARTLDYGCTCGALRGHARDLSARAGIRVVCMCDDCQAFAAFLAPVDIVDGAGGTDIFQLSPNRLTIATGLDQLRGVRLSAKGLIRWYAGCCKTPLGNTMSRPKVPFVGVPVVALHPADAHDDVLGPVRARINARFAPAGSDHRGHLGAPASLIVRSVRLLAGGALRRAHRPHPFFGPDGAPTAQPTVLAADQRSALGPVGSS